MNEEKTKQAALEFARLQPVQWDAFLAKWEAEHAETEKLETGLISEQTTVETSITSPEPTVEVQEAVAVPEVKKRKAVARKVKAADS